MMKQGIPFLDWLKVNGNWENNMIKISQWRESHCRTNTNIRKKVTARDPSRKFNQLSKIIWDRKIIAEFQIYQFNQNS